MTGILAAGLIVRTFLIPSNRMTLTPCCTLARASRASVSGWSTGDCSLAWTDAINGHCASRFKRVSTVTGGLWTLRMNQASRFRRRIVWWGSGDPIMDLAMSMIDQASKWMKRQLAPVTIGIMVAFIGLSLIFWFTGMKHVSSLTFDYDWTRRPWTILTYPFAYMGLGNINTIIWSIVLLGWMNLACAGVERTIGTPKYAVLWIVLTIVPALLFWAGEAVVQQGSPLAGPFFPVAGISYIWARTHKDYQISIWFVPLNGVWISWIIIAGVLFGYGMGAPLLGAFSALYLIPCHLYAENMIPFLPYEIKGYQYRPSKQQREKEANYFADVADRRRQRAERERLRKLFESSLDDDKK
jgi:hypothetical protein